MACRFVRKLLADNVLLLCSTTTAVYEAPGLFVLSFGGATQRD